MTTPADEWEPEDDAQNTGTPDDGTTAKGEPDQAAVEAARVSATVSATGLSVERLVELARAGVQAQQKANPTAPTTPPDPTGVVTRAEAEEIANRSRTEGELASMRREVQQRIDSTIMSVIKTDPLFSKHPDRAGTIRAGVSKLISEKQGIAQMNDVEFITEVEKMTASVINTEKSFAASVAKGETETDMRSRLNAQANEGEPAARSDGPRGRTEQQDNAQRELGEPIYGVGVQWATQAEEDIAHERELAAFAAGGKT